MPTVIKSVTEHNTDQQKYIHQHPGPRSIVSRIITPHSITPLLRRLRHLAVRAIVAPPRRVLCCGCALDEKATIGDTTVGRDALEHIGIGTGKDLAHHCAGGGSGGVYSIWVAAVLGDGVLDHVGNGLGVASAVVRKGCRSVS